jgi:hypothetical protein
VTPNRQAPIGGLGGAASMPRCCEHPGLWALGTQVVLLLVFRQRGLFVHVAPSLPKLKLARLAEREMRFLLLHRLTLYGCRVEVIIMCKPSKLSAC